MSTYTATPKDIEHRWFVVDADGMVLGRLAAEIVRILRGKHKPMYTPHMDTGDNVIVINAAKVKLTGRKLEQKQYFTHTATWGTSDTRPRLHAREAPGARDREGRLRHAAEERARSADASSQASRVCHAAHPHVAQQPAALTINAAQRDEVMADSSTTHAVGRRKEAVCRVYIVQAPASGTSTVAR
jgi:large subunit ribosomal protein L13